MNLTELTSLKLKMGTWLNPPVQSLKWERDELDWTHHFKGKNGKGMNLTELTSSKFKIVKGMNLTELTSLNFEVGRDELHWAPQF